MTVKSPPTGWEIALAGIKGSGRTIHFPPPRKRGKPLGLKRGRPPRQAGSGSPEEQRLFRQDMAIAHCVYAAVFKGMAYRDDALAIARKFAAKYFRRKITIDGIEAIVERCCRDPEVLFAAPPGMALRAMVNVLGPFVPDLAVPNGMRTLRYVRPEPFTPSGDDNIPAIKLRRRI